MSPSLCTIYKCRGRDVQSQLQMDKPSANCLRPNRPMHREQNPDPTWEAKLHLTVPLKRNQLKVAGGFFFFFFFSLFFSSIIYHSASERKKKKKSGKKGFVWEGSKTKNFGTEVKICFDVFTCQDIFLFDMCIALHLSNAPPPFSLFFFSNIYIKASKKYIKQHVSIHSLHLNSAPKG